MRHTPVEFYVDYLTTDEVVAAIERIEQRLVVDNGMMIVEKRRVLNQVLQDLYQVLRQRQMSLLDT